MTEEKKILCNGIIHSFSAATAGVGGGLAQLPGSDSVAIVSIQMAMAVALGEVFDINLDESAAKAAVKSASATIVGRTLSQFLIGWIPVAGNIINASTAFGLTEKIGWEMAREFDRKSSMACERLEVISDYGDYEEAWK